eukprot:403371579
MGQSEQEKPRIKPSANDQKLLSSQFNVSVHKVVKAYQNNDGDMEKTISELLRTY